MKRLFSSSATLILGFILALALLVGKLYFHAGFPYTHDGENHLARFANYKVALKEGQLPPRFAPNLMNHYGYPVFNYNYPLANIASLPFSLLKLNYQLTFKLMAITGLAFGLTGIWLWQQQLTVNSKLAQVIGLAAAATSPFVISLLYFRGNIGELLAWALLPWLFATTMSTPHTLAKWQQVLVVALWTAFFLSHNVTVLYVTPALALWVLVNHGKTQSAAHHYGLMCWGILSSLWFWLPAIWEKSEVILDGAGLSSGYADHFATFSQLLTSPLTFGFSKAGSIDSLSLGLGLVGVMAVIGLGGWILKNPSWFKQNRLTVALLGLATLCVIFQLSATKMIWEYLPLVRFVQFPWRLTLLFSLVSAVLVSKYFELNHRLGQVVIVFLLVIQLGAAVKTKPVDYFSKQIIDYDLFAQSTTTANENLPKSFTYSSFAASWNPAPSVSTSSALVTVESWTGSYRRYQVETIEPTTIIEPTMVFSGWQTSIHNLATKTTTAASYIDNEEIGGRLAYQLQPGKYQLTTRFTQLTPARVIGNTISSLAFVSLGLWLFLPSSLFTNHGKVKK